MQTQNNQNIPWYEEIACQSPIKGTHLSLLAIKLMLVLYVSHSLLILLLLSILQHATSWSSQRFSKPSSVSVINFRVTDVYADCNTFQI